ncbi:metal ABC transporter ATP-binding protein [Saccharicrinis aurantiacus]|uniref:metal ABC transporter ATP-binding protein n=1 Tax=Saccharicrinis aurantiacus TaxID=1849719 RepID=UPI00094F79DB|nr:ATP-binding cassette domain-containing protein [Saccharicrinis aurantiacus]
MDSLISLHNVSAGYEPNQAVLRNINLDIKQNDFIGIIGPNGGGKSTLLKVILGLLPIQKGKLNYAWKNNKHYIGYLPQSNEIDTKFPIKVSEVVLSGIMGSKSYFGKYSKSDKNKANELLDKLGLTEYKNNTIGELSGGQRQRAFLGRAIINKPSVLILDEPNTYVDKHFEGELYNMLSELNKEMAILLVSHDIGTISPIIKTIACVNEELHYHNSNKISEKVLSTYKCPIELVAHGHVPHRVLNQH